MNVLNALKLVTLINVGVRLMSIFILIIYTHYIDFFFLIFLVSFKVYDIMDSHSMQIDFQMIFLKGFYHEFIKTK